MSDRQAAPLEEAGLEAGEPIPVRRGPAVLESARRMALVFCGRLSPLMGTSPWEAVREARSGTSPERMLRGAFARNEYHWNALGTAAMDRALDGDPRLLRALARKGLPLQWEDSEASRFDIGRLLCDPETAEALACCTRPLSWVFRGIRTADTFAALCSCPDPLAVLRGSARARSNLAAFAKLLAAECSGTGAIHDFGLTMQHEERAVESLLNAPLPAIPSLLRALADAGGFADAPERTFVPLSAPLGSLPWSIQSHKADTPTSWPRRWLARTVLRACMFPGSPGSVGQLARSLRGYGTWTRPSEWDGAFLRTLPIGLSQPPGGSALLAAQAWEAAWGEGFETFRDRILSLPGLAPEAWEAAFAEAQLETVLGASAAASPSRGGPRI